MSETAEAAALPRDTAKVPGRRILRFDSIDEAMAEVGSTGRGGAGRSARATGQLDAGADARAPGLLGGVQLYRHADEGAVLRPVDPQGPQAEVPQRADAGRREDSRASRAERWRPSR